MVEEGLTPIGPEVRKELESVGPADQAAGESLNLEPLPEHKLRWNVSWGEMLSADPEKLRFLMANMNEQIKRLYELSTLEVELGRPLTKEEIDLTLHREKAGHGEQADQV